MPLKELLGIFPRLKGTRPQITSPCNGNYNCTAWAIRDEIRWWEPYGLVLPSPFPPYHWPAELPQDLKAETFVRFFELNGFELAADESVEAGFIKIALYVQNGEYRHVARQLSATKWTSKIGEREDISHELRALEGDGKYGYGVASIFMRKPV